MRSPLSSVALFGLVGLLASVALALLGAVLAPAPPLVAPALAAVNRGHAFESWTVATERQFGVVLLTSHWHDRGYFDPPLDPRSRWDSPSLAPSPVPADELPSWAKPPPTQDTLRTEHTAHVLRIGWPLVAFEGGSVFHAPLIGQASEAMPRTSILVARSVNITTHVPFAILPYQPILSGVAGNTLILGAAAWLLTFAPGAIVRSVRRRLYPLPGLCRNCGYPTLSSPRCSECGQTRSA